jgi:hypothetical protein
MLPCGAFSTGAGTAKKKRYGRLMSNGNGIIHEGERRIHQVLKIRHPLRDGRTPDKLQDKDIVS